MIPKKIYCATQSLARELAWQLEHQQRTIVFAESCTAGLVSAILAQVPGISRWHCGSAVTYQNATKQQWLDVAPELIAKHTSVSPEVTSELAKSVLKRTPHADFSVAVTGHLEQSAALEGPGVFVCVGYRIENNILSRKPVRFQLTGHTRTGRQWQAAGDVLHAAVDHLYFPPDANPMQVNWAQVFGRSTNYHWNHWS